MCASRRSQWRPRTFTQLLALVSSAAAITLSDFQAISSTQVPSNCLIIYQTTILGCTSTDFADGGQCSIECAQGLLDKQGRVQTFCAGLDVNPWSLLGLTLSGNLLEVLCDGFVTTTQTIPKATTTQKFQTIPFSSKTTTTTAPGTSTTMGTTDTDSKGEGATQTQETTSTVIPPSETSTTTTEEETTTTEEESTTATRAGTTTVTAGVSTTSSTRAIQAPSQSVIPIQDNGSPFADVNFISSSAPRLILGARSIVLFTAAAVAFLFMG